MEFDLCISMPMLSCRECISEEMSKAACAERNNVLRGKNFKTARNWHPKGFTCLCADTCTYVAAHGTELGNWMKTSFCKRRGLVFQLD